MRSERAECGPGDRAPECHRPAQRATRPCSALPIWWDRQCSGHQGLPGITGASQRRSRKAPGGFSIQTQVAREGLSGGAAVGAGSVVPVATGSGTGSGKRNRCSGDRRRLVEPLLEPASHDWGRRLAGTDRDPDRDLGACDRRALRRVGGKLAMVKVLAVSAQALERRAAAGSRLARRVRAPPAPIWPASWIVCLAGLY